MSEVDGEEKEAADIEVMCCACCGKAEVDDVKLKICTACRLVKYCSVECQKNHRPQHKKACKKRVAEIRDDRLFRQPDESYLGECPICCLPLPIDSKSMIHSCCCKRICKGCNYANRKREMEEDLEQRCPYCREPLPETGEENEKNYMKRFKANDPVAMCQMGKTCREEGDYEGAIPYFTKAAELGDADSHFNLSVMYRLEEGVKKDMKKEVYHLEEAAIGGHPNARYNLGVHEGKNNGRIDRAVKHFIIATKLGHDNALENVKKGFMDGDVSKEDFEAALRGHQAAVDATKSEQREKAEIEFQQRQSGLLF
jgi:tetratricopeptide (TPR) repeat protein